MKNLIIVMACMMLFITSCKNSANNSKPTGLTEEEIKNVDLIGMWDGNYSSDYTSYYFQVSLYQDGTAEFIKQYKNQNGSSMYGLGGGVQKANWIDHYLELKDVNGNLQNKRCVDIKPVYNDNDVEYSFYIDQNGMLQGIGKSLNGLILSKVKK